MEYLGSNKKPVKNRTKVRFHTGANEILGHAILLDREELEAGKTAVAQFRLEAPVCAVKDDRFVIRSYSPIRTIGGGRIINPIPKKHKRFKESITVNLKLLAESSPDEVVTCHIRESGLRGVAFSDLIIMTNTAEGELEQRLQHLLSDKAIVQVDRENRIFLHSSVFDGLRDKTIRALADYHKEYPLKAGMSKEALKSKLPQALSHRALNVLLQNLTKTDTVVQEKEAIRLSGHTIALGSDQKDIRHKIEEAYRDNGLQPPYFRELAASMRQDSGRIWDVLGHMLEEGVLVKVKEDLYFHKAVIEALRYKLVSYLKENTEITTPQFKEMTGVTRKYMIPLIEYFDVTRVTIRVGDIRRLREG
ncbi:MAG: SelB C-terminal domain-containing protein, partial [Desulfobacterales bacterium]|nr:SelB C-terminal domain-containing protein [Desulfobacterales bacterium]